MINYDSHNWFDHFFDLRGSLLPEISVRVTLCTVWAIGVVSFHYFVKPIGIPPTIHSLIGIALGLLLVFRTNSSYDRFWEGRKLWGGITNECRNLGRAAAVLLADAPDLLERLLTWTMVFPHTTMLLLRGSRGLGPTAAGLPAPEVQATLRADHLPLAVARRVSEHLDEARRRGLVSDYGRWTLDQNVQLLVDYLGGCERILRTPLPFA